MNYVPKAELEDQRWKQEQRVADANERELWAALGLPQWRKLLHRKGPVLSAREITDIVEAIPEDKRPEYARQPADLLKRTVALCREYYLEQMVPSSGGSTEARYRPSFCYEFNWSE